MSFFCANGIDMFAMIPSMQHDSTNGQISQSTAFQYDRYTGFQINGVDIANLYCLKASMEPNFFDLNDTNTTETIDNKYYGIHGDLVQNFYCYAIPYIISGISHTASYVNTTTNNPIRIYEIDNTAGNNIITVENSSNTTKSFNLTSLVVAGGGGGGYTRNAATACGGGGGGGEVIMSISTVSVPTLSTATITVSIGGGGRNGTTSYRQGTDGTDSSLNIAVSTSYMTIVANGGGGGGAAASIYNDQAGSSGNPGGSGGGYGAPYSTPNSTNSVSYSITGSTAVVKSGPLITLSSTTTNTLVKYSNIGEGKASDANPLQPLGTYTLGGGGGGARTVGFSPGTAGKGGNPITINDILALIPTYSDTFQNLKCNYNSSLSLSSNVLIKNITFADGGSSCTGNNVSTTFSYGNGGDSAQYGTKGAVILAFTSLV